MKLDIQTILYIIAAIIYFLYSISKAKKKEAAKRKNYIPPQSTNVPSYTNDNKNTRTQETRPEPQKPFSFETILKELEKNMNPEYEETPTPAPELPKKTPYSIETKQVPRKQEKKWERIREDKGEGVRKGELKDSIPSKLYSIENEPKKVKPIIKTATNIPKPGKKSSLYSYFHSTSKLREAVILSEILNRKEE